MNIAILGSRGFPSTYGGYETLVRYVARDWATKGHRVSVYCRARPSLRGSWAVDGVRCIWTPGYDSKSFSTLSYGATSHFDALFRRYDAALVLNIANGYFLPLLRWRGIPTVVNTDGLEWRRGKWGPLARRMFYWGAHITAAYADSLVVDSEAIGKTWRTLFSAESRFIPYGGDIVTDAGDDRIRQLGLTPHSYTLVVARLIPENNVDLFLDALDLMPDRPPAVVVGSATYGSQLEGRLRQLHGQGLIKWLGHVADQVLLTQLWANAGCYVHGHSVGGTNPALLQALGAGSPTLALDTEFNREVLKEDAQLFQGEAACLAGRIAMVLADKTQQDNFSSRGQDIVRRRYSWQDVSTAYLQALEDARFA